MNRWVAFFLSLLLAGTAALAQNAPASAPSNAAAPPTVRWTAPSDYNPQDPAQQRAARRVESNGVTLFVSFSDYPEYKFTRVNVEIANDSSAPVDVDLSKITFEQVKPEQKTLKQLDPKKLAKNIELQEYSDNQADQMHGNGGAMMAGASTGNVSQSGNRRTIAYAGTSYLAAEFLRETALNAGPVVPGQHAIGGVYFDLSKKRTEGLARITVGQTTFEIPCGAVIKDKK
jgi:hypothetical protein